MLSASPRSASVSTRRADRALLNSSCSPPWVAASELRTKKRHRPAIRSPSASSNTDWGDAQPERIRGLDVDHELELGRLLNRQIAWVRALQGAIDVTLLLGGIVLSNRQGHRARRTPHQLAHRIVAIGIDGCAKLRSDAGLDLRTAGLLTADTGILLVQAMVNGRGDRPSRLSPRCGPAVE